MSSGMSIEDRIAALIAPSLESMGYELVRVQLQGQKRPVLQIMAERADRAPMTVEDCADISRSVSALLDVDDPISDAYTLEVSSPGIDRPLTRRQDYERFSGFEAKIETQRPVDGRKRFRGRLLGIDASEQVRLGQEDGDLLIPYADIHRAKLVLTDDLIAAAQLEQDDNQG
ncbi:ribosome maturation factor RimP [mine drainage metagenome]|uniref:Ribosome maturation factor RimP n=1 Tax=mine drainage metagenome TaxID=410659 RepID=A0A1J5SYW5_9ZZZZ